MTSRDILKSRGDKGFTLIELLVVILVIGVLSGIVVLAVQNSTVNARKKACAANASTLLSALETYRATGSATGAYPPAAAGATAVSGATGSYKEYTSAELAGALVPNYIKSIPYSTATNTTGVTAYLKDDGTTVIIKLTGTDCAAAATDVFTG